MPKRLDVCMSDTLFNWIVRKAKQLAFPSTAAYVRHVFEDLRLKEIGAKDEDRPKCD